MAVLSITQNITELADFIAQYNTYFDNYFPSAEQDDMVGIVNDGMTRIFPSDEYGNYFYLRYPDVMTFSYSNDMMIADTGGSVGVKTEMFLIAAVRQADEALLIQNLLTTLAAKCSSNIQFVQVKTNVHVILQELSKIKKEEQESALQRAFESGYTYVSIRFIITQPYIFQSLRCITDPCKTC